MTLDPTRAGFRTPPPGESTQPAAAPPPPAFLRPPLAPDELGRLGNYRVLRLIGAGGMGQVFHAEDLVLRRPVALKIMHPDLPDFAAAGERFLREARALAGIAHDNLVPVYQAGQEGDVFFMAMQLLQGETLHARLARAGPPEPALMMRIARETACGLVAIHERGLIHRDLKPSNIWLEAPSGRVRILDFGLARSTDTPSDLTRTGMVVGTPAFMAPEQARGQAVDARSDLFSFGAVLYCLATGRQPFQGDTLMAQLTALAVDTPAPARAANPKVPERLSDLIGLLLSKDPAKRPTSAEDVLVRLEGGGTRTFVRKIKRNRMPLVIGALALAALLAALLWPHPPKPEPRPEPEAKAEVKAAPIGPGTSLLDLVRDEDPKVAVWFPPESGKKSAPMVPGPPNAFRRMMLLDAPSPRGIGMHPTPDGPAYLEVRLDGKYRRFRAKVGQNVGPPPLRDPVIFSVLGDGKTLWRSRPNHGGDETEAAEVDVTGVRTLRLELTAEGEPRAAHMLWFEPVLE
ncbi:MAG TPA: protein kinase [Planctomycetota bacterium]